MERKDLKKYIITESMSVVEAMRRLDITGKGILFVADRNDVLCGCLTDGDIRRWIIKTGHLTGNVGIAMHRNPKYLYKDSDIDASQMMIGHTISSIPIVDEEKRIVNILFDVNINNTPGIQTKKSVLKNTDIIIMAGGKGTRLFPYTKILPKPLIPIGDIPILERIMNRFSEYGADHFFLTVNYKKEMIKSYFYDKYCPYEIRYIEEEQPLGTAGSIRLIKEDFKSPVIVTNCDILIEADYGSILEYHEFSKNDMTIVSSLKNMTIQYGILHVKEEGIITSIEEKPQLSFLINTGMYVVNPKYLEWIPEGVVFHMTDLVEKMMKEGKRVGMYPISENSFLDMGEFEEMKKMEEKIAKK